MYTLYRESLMKRTGRCESDFNANSANKAKASPPAFDPDFSEAGELVPRKLDDPVRARPQRVVYAPVAFSTVNRLCVPLLCVHAGCLTPQERRFPVRAVREGWALPRYRARPGAQRAGVASHRRQCRLYATLYISSVIIYRKYTGA